jgi:hypothetical protein
MQRITNRRELVELAKKLGVRDDWHEPDEQGITAEVRGLSFDNAGFWPHEAHPGLNDLSQEQYVVLQRQTYNHDGELSDPEDLACINLATLCAWATGLEN